MKHKTLHHQVHKTVVVLLHHPVTNRKGETVATSITNMDLHDISRTCRTFEIDHYYLVSPIIDHQKLVGSIIEHWQKGSQAEWHPDRAEALSRVKVLSSFQDVKDDLTKLYPGLPLEVTMPDARPLPNQLTYAEARKKWQCEAKMGIKLVVLGTGWGVAPEFYQEVHTYLGPIYGPLGSDGYNHLSVRAAAAIILDRLFSVEQ